MVSCLCTVLLYKLQRNCFTDREFVQITGSCSVQSFVINCFFWRGYYQKKTMSQERFWQASLPLNVFLGFNHCYYCTQLMQFRYDVVKIVVTTRKPNIYDRIRRVAGEPVQKLDAHPSMPKISKSN